MVFEVTFKQYFGYVIHYEGHNDISGPDNCNSVECQNIGEYFKLNTNVRD